MIRAGFLHRGIALFIDYAIVGAITGLLTFLGDMTDGVYDLGKINEVRGHVSTTLSISLLFSWVLQFIYYGYFLSKNGQTPGKQLLGIRVIDRNGSSPSFLIGGLRGNVGYWISWLVFGLGFIWALFDSKKETWHDKIFGTEVIST